MERLYRQDAGVFAHPVWPTSVLVPQKVINDDKALHDVLAQCSMAALPLTRGVVKLEATISLPHPSRLCQDRCLCQLVSSFKEGINAHIATALAHALHLIWVGATLMK